MCGLPVQTGKVSIVWGVSKWPAPIFVLFIIGETLRMIRHFEDSIREYRTKCNNLVHMRSLIFHV